LIVGCSSTNDEKRIKILNHSIGDSLACNYDTIQVMDKPYIFGRDINDTRLEFTLIDKFISDLTFDDLNENEIKNFKIEITRILNQTPKHTKDKKAAGIVFYGDYYEWFDSLSYDQIRLFVRSQKGEKITGSLTIENEKIRKELLRKFDPDYFRDSIMTEELNEIYR
jgi:hypothetical protein